MGVVGDVIPNCTRAYCYTNKTNSTYNASCSWRCGVYEYGITVSRYEVERSRTPHNIWTEYIGAVVPTSGAIVAAISVYQQYQIQVIAPKAATHKTTSELALVVMWDPNLLFTPTQSASRIFCCHVYIM